TVEEAVDLYVEAGQSKEPPGVDRTVRALDDLTRMGAVLGEPLDGVVDIVPGLLGGIAARQPGTGLVSSHRALPWLRLTGSRGVRLLRTVRSGRRNGLFVVAERLPGGLLEVLAALVNKNARVERLPRGSLDHGAGVACSAADRHGDEVAGRLVGGGNLQGARGVADVVELIEVQGRGAVVVGQLVRLAGQQPGVLSGVVRQ